MSSTLFTRGGAIVLVALALALGTNAYLDLARPTGDLNVADAAVEGLTLLHGSAFAMGSSTPYSNALEDNWATIDLYLHSDTRDRLPDVSGHIETAWTAYLVADEVWRRAEEGTATPLVSEVYAAERLLAAAPELRAVVTGEGASARFDNTDLKAVEALFAVGKAERDAAARSIAERRAGVQRR